VSIAPFGSPVVPEVQNCAHTAPSTSRCGSSPSRGRSANVMVGTPVAVAVALNSAPVTISFGLTSSTICLISCGVSRQFNGAATRPALSSANNNSKYAAQFLSRMPTRSPTSRPSLSTRPAASCDVDSLNAAKVVDLPSNQTASSEGCRRALQRSISAIVRIRAFSADT
jgi:hypothetical protein